MVSSQLSLVLNLGDDYVNDNDDDNVCVYISIK